MGRGRRQHHALDPDARGGHFAAFEQPELLVADVRAFYRDRRESAGLTRRAPALCRQCRSLLRLTRSLPVSKGAHHDYDEDV